MKFIKLTIFILFTAFFITSCKKNAKDISEVVPEYRLIVDFSKKIRTDTDLILCGYGINNYLPDGYKFKNGIANFSASYVLKKMQQDVISLEDARRLVVSVTEGLTATINADSEIIPHLDTYPVNSDLIRVSIYFQDENEIELGSGVAEVHFYNGKIKYRRYDIREYSNVYPAVGKHFIIHEENYVDALELINKQGNLISP